MFSTSSSSGGGRGGYSYSTNNGNPEQLLLEMQDGLEIQDESCGGVGGRPLDYSTGRLFLGGGGGSGMRMIQMVVSVHRGGNGGGIIYIICYGDLTGSGTINSDGARWWQYKGPCEV
ncbi:MAG: hypothetical protein IPJ32_03600 [Sphingobacteriaceae bacterium]|nr:hypothetical protein [Sphingobacteriaceae bacterium]